MSSVIKIARKNNSAGIRLQNILDGADLNLQTEEDYWKKHIAEAQQKAYEEGRSDAVAELENRYAQNLLVKYGEFEELAGSLNNAFAEYEANFEKIILQLSVMIAEKIIKREVEEKTIIAECIKEASQKLIGADSIIIKLNPADYDTIKESSKGLFNDENFSKVSFETDHKINRGGCFIESEIGNLDARISTQISELSKQIEKNYLSQTK